jgi:ribosomal protein S18 acetylase RimI-like enzyme
MCAYVKRMTIRVALPADLPAVASMCQRWQSENNTRNYRAEQVAELTLRLGEFFLLGELAGEIVAFIIAQVKPVAGDDIADGAFQTLPEKYLEVQDLYVLPEHRNRGMGSAMVGDLYVRAKARGLTCSMVYSANLDYVRAARFYEKCGFRMWHIFLTREL